MFRCIAPDLIGMGNSDKVKDLQYTFEDHVRYLDAWFDAVLPSEPIYLVLHDWGSALGFHWARRHPDRILGVCYMEAIVKPFSNWEDWPKNARGIFQKIRSSGTGEAIILEKNAFIEKVLPSSILRRLDSVEMGAYRAPFKEMASRLPTLRCPPLLLRFLPRFEVSL